jgi:hypothetical protein
MSVTQTQIEELDSVALLEPVEIWPAGTRGVVQGVKGSHRLVEVVEYDDIRDVLDHIIVARTDQLRLVHKHRSPRP